MIKLGTYHTLRILRHTDPGIYLEGDETTGDILLPLTAVTSPAPKRRVRRSDSRLDTMVPQAMSMEITPAKDRGAPSSRRISGQAEPSSESGRPRLMKAR